jgi:hypothetical protein
MSSQNSPLSAGAKKVLLPNPCPPGYVRGRGATGRYTCRRKTSHSYQGRKLSYVSKKNGKCPSGYRKSQAKGKRSKCVKGMKITKSRNVFSSPRDFKRTYAEWMESNRGPVLVRPSPRYPSASKAYARGPLVVRPSPRGNMALVVRR